MLVTSTDPSACPTLPCTSIAPPPCVITRLRQRTNLRRRATQQQRQWQLLGLRTSQHSRTHGVLRTPRCPHAASDGDGSIEPIILQQPTAQQLTEQRERLAQQVTAWLDDEWLPQAVHKDLGGAAAEAYTRQREGGEADMGSVLLAVISELQAFNFHDTFTDPFEVGNKLAELVMLSEGREVGGCCVPGDAADH